MRKTTPYRPEGLDDAFAEPTSSDAGADGSAGDGSPADGPRSAGGGAPSTSAAPVAVPAIGLRGWLRWTWRQITSMRVALLLLMLLAVAAVPGTVFPQNAQDADKVTEFLADHTTIGPWMDRASLFDVYGSPWFSAIYILLMVSLVGCILPRTAVHWRALRGRPPRTPRRFDRFPAQGRVTLDDAPQDVVARAAADLRRPVPGLPFWPRHRVDVVEEGPGRWSVTAERGYLRETGNLVFHLALVGLLVSVATGQLLHWKGQAIVVQGHGFANAETAYDTFEEGILFDPSSLVPFSMTLDSFSSVFDDATLQARDFTAGVTVTEPDGSATSSTIKVNHPLDVDGAEVYLQGNGYAPTVSVTDASGATVFAGDVPFLPQDTVYTSQGVIKVPDVTTGEQIGLVGYLLPTGVEVGEGTGIWQSVNPQPDDPVLVLTVWTGDLGLDTGVPQNVYVLDESGMTQVLEDDGTTPVQLVLHVGDTVELPDGLGTITFEGLPRFVALDLRYDPALRWILVFALLAFAGLATSLFAPRRRLWVRAVADAEGGRTLVTAAGLARGDDVGLTAQVARLLTAASGAPPGPTSPSSAAGAPTSTSTTSTTSTTTRAAAREERTDGHR